MSHQEELNEVKQQLETLTRRKRQLETLIDETKSRQFIALTGMTKDQVQLSSGPGVPWHGNVSTFAAWVATQHPRKRWCEWNTQIHHTDELCAGRFSPTPARLQDLK